MATSLQKRRLRGILFFVFLFLHLFSGRASAENAGSLSVYPLFTDVSLSEGDALKDFQLVVSNSTAEPVVLRISLVDFGSLNESGGIAFLGKEVNGVNRYALASWIVPEKDVVTLLPGSEEQLKFTLENRESLSPGGHYGAILFSVEKEGMVDEQNSSNIAVNSTFSTLVFAKKEGGAIQELSLKDQTAAQYSWWSGLPEEISLRFQNSGNTDVVPRGRTVLLDPFGSVVAKGILNEDSARILPESFRQYRLRFSPLSLHVIPGFYTITTEYRFDGQESLVVPPSQRVFAWGVCFWWTIAFGMIFIGIRSWLKNKTSRHG